MKFSLNLVKQYVDLKDVSMNEFCQKLSLAGFEVEGLTPLAQATNLIIGEIISCENHPNSDHLHVCKVDIKKTILQIVCGAPNVKNHQKVIVAQVGAQLPAKDLIIKEGMIRDVLSQGMICSLLELGVSEQNLTEEQKNGIEVLDKDAPVGETEVLKYLGLDDILVEMNVTPNRSDVFALHALMIEIGAILNKKVNLPSIEDSFCAENPFVCESQTEKCPYFSIRSVQAVTVKPSPKWMQEILTKHDVKVINNVIDIGNYVTLMTGQPLHMYDADKLKTKHYIIKDDQERKVLALDGKEYAIQKQDIVVTNGDEVVCIAGVIGDASTMIDENTKNIALEAALFDGTQILNSCKRFNLMTVAATNFSKKAVDEYQMNLASAYAAQLLVEYADAKIVSKPSIYQKVIKSKKTITITKEYINRYLATNYSDDQIEEVFSRLQMHYTFNHGTYIVDIPTYRNDLENKQDLVEEVVRLIGFDTIPYEMPIFETKEIGLTETQRKRKIIKNYLLDIGLTETLSYTLQSKATATYYDQWDQEEFIVLPHPLTVEKEYLRKSLMASMLQTIYYNQARKTKNVAIFELSNVYTKQGEKEKLAIAISNGMNQTKWTSLQYPNDFYRIKGIVEGLLALFGIESSRFAFEPITSIFPNQNLYHPGKAAVLKINGQVMGTLGEIHPLTLQKEDIDATIYFELDLTKFFALKTSKLKYSPVSKYPLVQRDISLVVKEEISAIQIVKTIKKAGGSLLKDVDIFDVYQGEHVQLGYKSIALTISFVDYTKTLQDADIQTVFNKIYAACQKELQAELRK